MELSGWKLNASQVKALESDPEVLAAVEKFTDDHIVPEMRRRAPKASGEGAESIESEPAPDEPGFRVSWHKQHFYLGFAELGTEDQAATPFMRPVADEFNRR